MYSGVHVFMFTTTNIIIMKPNFARGGGGGGGVCTTKTLRNETLMVQDNEISITIHDKIT